MEHLSRRAARALIVVLVVALLGPALTPAASAARTPQDGDFFLYRFVRHVGSGGGEYEDYSDSLVSDGVYSVLSANATGVTMHTRYVWSYANNEGTRQGDTEDRIIAFNTASRLYTSTQTDYDELDGHPANLYATWFWVSPDVRVGQSVQVLDTHLTVISREATIWLGYTPYKAIMLQGDGIGSRNDIYGVFNYDWQDTYYYDIETGWFMAERYVEHDQGTWQGRSAYFTWSEDMDFLRGSYTPPVDAGALYGFWAGVLAFFVLMGLGAYAFTQRPRTLHISDLGRVRVANLKDVARFEAALPRDALATGYAEYEGPLAVEGVTNHFGHFLADFARKAKSSGDRVAYATMDGRVAGLALHDEEGDIGCVFAANTGLAETLRRMVRSKDFFSEARHPVPRWSRDYASERGVSFRSGDAYNLMDTFEVLVLRRFPASGYDAGLVSRMRPEDLGQVTSIAQKVFKANSSKWIRAQAKGGDIGFVAKVDGRIVGFGFATAIGQAGRLHTLAVLPEYRGRGIGRELVRARLQALEALGARYVVAEVARWNLASLQLLFAHGFEKAGEMYVETARKSRPTRQVFRR